MKPEPYARGREFRNLKSSKTKIDIMMMTVAMIR